MYSVKEAYDRISIKQNRILNLVEMWDGGPTEGHLFICKNENDFILCETIHHFNSKSESKFEHKLTNTSNLEMLVTEIESFCKCRYNGTLNFDFRKLHESMDVAIYFGF